MKRNRRVLLLLLVEVVKSPGVKHLWRGGALCVRQVIHVLPLLLRNIRHPLITMGTNRNVSLIGDHVACRGVRSGREVTRMVLAAHSNVLTRVHGSTPTPLSSHERQQMLVAVVTRRLLKK